MNSTPAADEELELLNAILDLQVDGVAEDLNYGDPPARVIATTVAMCRRDPDHAARLLGVALLRLATEGKS